MVALDMLNHRIHALLHEEEKQEGIFIVKDLGNWLCLALEMQGRLFCTDAFGKRC